MLNIIHIFFHITNLCPVEYTINIIGGKWKTIILWHLSNEGVLRYGGIKKVLGKITHKTLSTQLKELESDGLIYRNEYPQVPPKVEYSLTDKGKSVLPVLKAICEWETANMPSIVED